LSGADFESSCFLTVDPHTLGQDDAEAVEERSLCGVGLWTQRRRI